MSQPRRIAARSAAARMAFEDGSSLGSRVGFKTRFESRVSRDSRIVVMTEGLLTRTIQSDPFLQGTSCVVLDEFHERSVDVDLALAFLKEIMSDARPDLKLIVMSATLEVEPLVSYLGATSMIVDAPLFPIEIKHDRFPDERALPEKMSSAIAECTSAHEGDVLAFLPGIAAMHRTKNRLSSRLDLGVFNVLELHGDLSSKVQDLALAPSKKRKVILSTNIAETSVTVPGVRIVIDSGLAKILSNDTNLGLDRLEEKRISLASARQRSGRAGREGAGFARRLWTPGEERAMAEQNTPEIKRLDLASALLQVLSWGARSVASFDWFETPGEVAMDRALHTLFLLRAVMSGPHGQVLTSLGRSLSRVPLHPRLGVLLRESQRLGAGKSGALACAILGERDVLNMEARRNLGKQISGRSDLQVRLDLVERPDQQVNRQLRKRILTVARRLESSSQEVVEMVAAKQEEALARAVLAAFPDRVARRRQSDRRRALMVGGRGLLLFDESVVDEGEFFCALRLSAGRRGQGSDSPVTWASVIEESWLAEDFPSQVRTNDHGEFDPEKGRVVCYRTRRFFDLVLSQKKINLNDGALAGEILARATYDHSGLALGIVVDAKTESLLRRCAFLRENCPELSLPDFSKQDLVTLIASLCPGHFRFEELRGQGLRQLVEAEIGYQMMAKLNKEAPEEIVLTNGRRLTVTYEPGSPPKISAKVQHFFGQVETPTLAMGRVAARVELLAPNRRAVQLTSDLANFWRETYGQVRKDLRGRYPKHDWPENPPGI